MIDIHISYVKTKRHKNMIKMFAVVTYWQNGKVTAKETPQVYTSEKLYLEIDCIKQEISEHVANGAIRSAQGNS